MIAFKISVNGNKVCTASVGWDSFMHVEVRRAPAIGSQLSVVGIESTTNEYLEWAVPEIKLGDKVCIEIIDADYVDEPLMRSVAQELKPKY